MARPATTSAKAKTTITIRPRATTNIELKTTTDSRLKAKAVNKEKENSGLSARTAGAITKKTTVCNAAKSAKRQVLGSKQGMFDIIKALNNTHNGFIQLALLITRLTLLYQSSRCNLISFVEISRKLQVR